MILGPTLSSCSSAGIDQATSVAPALVRDSTTVSLASLLTMSWHMGQTNEYVDVEVVTHSWTLTLLTLNSTSPQVAQVARTIGKVLAVLLRGRLLLTPKCLGTLGETLSRSVTMVP